MLQPPLPGLDEMQRAVAARDATYDGVFFTAVKTTGIFCRPTCPARTPRPDNVEFFPSARDAVLAGYRPCLRCRPLEPGGTEPEWLRGLLEAVERDPLRRWSDADLRALDLEPARVRRWFQREHSMTFHGYLRARRLGKAMGRLRLGEDLTQVALDHGYDSLSGFREAFGKVFRDAPGRSRGRSHVIVTRIPTPLGPMIAGADEEGVCLLEFVERRMLATQLDRLARQLRCSFAPGSNARLEQIADELRRYFEGTLREFATPLVLRGTDFQLAAWRALQRIPFGETRSYGEQARLMDRSRAVRAVGRANGDNRIAIVIPCHRVVGSDGRLTGYGGGLWRKRVLLEHERRVAGETG